MIRCPNCNREHLRSVLTCDCGFDLQTYAEKLEVAQKQHSVATRPYTVLPILLIVLRVMGVLSVLGGSIYALLLYAKEEPAWMIVMALFGGVLAGVPYFALSEALTILLQMSEKQDKLMLVLERVEKKG
jgi:hypothetical protein